jgi:hypothetical protein
VTEGRLATSIWVSALLRRANAAGAFGAVLAKGDATAGAVLLIARSREGDVRAYQRRAGLGKSRWALAAKGAEAVDGFAERQRRYDEDLWVVELVTEDIAQLIDETIDER